MAVTVVVWLLGAMIVWSVFAVGGVYEWAGVPLLAAAAVVVVVARPIADTPGDTRALDRSLVATVIAVALQLVPLPQSLRFLLSPHADEIRSAVSLEPIRPDAWLPISIAPASTLYALGLVLASLVTFRAARAVFARGRARQLIRVVAFTGLAAAFLAIAVQHARDPSLIYGRWHALDAGARPFGPFVNRNHFATWIVMACPLAAGYAIAALSARRRSADRLARKIVVFFDSLGTSASWAAVSAVVMVVALVISTSRSGLVALAASIVVGAWLLRTRLPRGSASTALLALVTLGAIVLAYANVESLLSRVDETIGVGAGSRPQIWHETERLIRGFWATGTGLGAFQTAMLVTQQGDLTFFINQAHSQYLQILAEGGVLVTAPLLFVVAAFGRALATRLMEDRSPSFWLRAGALVAVIAVAVQGVWETGLRIPANGVLIGIVAAVAVYRQEPRA